MNRPTLIALATGWSPKHGDINSFNDVFLQDAKETQDALVSLIPFKTPSTGEKLE